MKTHTSVSSIFLLVACVVITAFSEGAKADTGSSRFFPDSKGHLKSGLTIHDQSVKKAPELTSEAILKAQKYVTHLFFPFPLSAQPGKKCLLLSASCELS